MNVFQIDSEDLPQEIIKVFGEAASQASLISIDEAPYGYEWRFEYLARRSWLEIAYDQWFLNGHIEEELYFMSKDGFLYYLPGFLVGSLIYRHTSCLVRSLAGIFCSQDEWAVELFVHLQGALSLEQRQAILHWLMVQINRAEEAGGGDPALTAMLWTAISRWGVTG